jgi:ABC-type uncharacterized transport system ATPase component
VALCEEDSTGKSILLNLIAGVITPDSGDVWIGGHSLTHAPQQAKARLAYDLGLEPHLDKRFEQMSIGTRSKVFVTAAASGDPAAPKGVWLDTKAVYPNMRLVVLYEHTAVKIVSFV